MSERTIIIAFGAAALFIIVTMIVFMVLYRKKVNRRLKEAAEGIETNKKPMIPPVKFFIVTLFLTIVMAFVFLLAMAGIASLSYTQEITVRTNSTAQFRQYNTKQLENTPFADYKKFGDEISGYKKYTKQESDIIINYYILENKELSFLPPAAYAADYTGDKKAVYVSERQMIQGKNYGGGTSQGGKKFKLDKQLNVLELGTNGDNDIETVEITVSVYFEEPESDARDIDFEKKMEEKAAQKAVLVLTKEDIFGKNTDGQRK
ncbi:hypothetical protein [uncultured Ruminococcus sp.]|uniref:hypothetical protein n=1 Tax=uncultured Ruminococcus sp. TaxID=165186 RepID=UPI0025FC46E4|nr:hypothetical protein [uncultured Ruminococcus sp.]